MKFVKSFDWIGAILCVLFNILLISIGIGPLDNPISFLLLNAVYFANDTHKYFRGLNEGGEMVKQIWGIK